MEQPKNELKVEGVFYLQMMPEETEKDALSRFFNKLNAVGIDKLDCSIQTEVNEI